MNGQFWVFARRAGRSPGQSEGCELWFLGGVNRDLCSVLAPAGWVPRYPRNSRTMGCINGVILLLDLQALRFPAVIFHLNLMINFVGGLLTFLGRKAPIESVGYLARIRN